MGFNFNQSRVQLRQIDDRNRVRVSSVDRSRVEYECVPHLLLLGDVRVPVADEIEVALVHDLIKQALIVTVKKGDFSTVARDLTVPAVTRVLRVGGNGILQAAGAVVDVPEDKVSGPRCEQGGDLCRANVATVNDFIHLVSSKRGNGLTREGDVRVCVTDDSESCHALSDVEACGLPRNPQV